MGPRIQTPEQLRAQQKKSEQRSRLRRAQRLTNQWAILQESRDDAIRNALEVCSIREVAAATGLSSARVHQIRHGK